MNTEPSTNDERTRTCPTGSDDAETITGTPKTADGTSEGQVSGGAACCASLFVEILVLAQSIQPPFVLRAEVADTEAGAWYTVVSSEIRCCAVKPEIALRSLGAQYAGILAEALRGDPQHTPESLTPFALRVIRTIRAMDGTTQQQVLEMLGRLGTQTECQTSYES